MLPLVLEILSDCWIQKQWDLHQVSDTAILVLQHCVWYNRKWFRVFSVPWIAKQYCPVCDWEQPKWDRPMSLTVNGGTAFTWGAPSAKWYHCYLLPAGCYFSQFSTNNDKTTACPHVWAHHEWLRNLEFSYNGLSAISGGYGYMFMNKINVWPMPTEG